MTYIEINGTRYPAIIHGNNRDNDWNGRESKQIFLNMSLVDVIKLFKDDVEWSIVYQADSYVDENGETVIPEPEIYDNSEYCIVGSVSVKMGKPTAKEINAILMGG